MSDSGFTPSFSPRRKWAIAASVFLSALALITILLLANYLAARHPRRLNWSADPRFQLSPVSKDVLRSLTNQVKVIVLFDRTKPLFDFVSDLLSQYQAASPRLQVEYVDYSRSPGRAKLVQTEYALVGDGGEQGGFDDRIIFDSGTKRRVVYAKQLSEFDYNALMRGQEVRRTGFKGEQLFTSALFSLADPRPVRVYFLQGHKEHDPTDPDDQAGYLKFAKALEESQITVDKLDSTALLRGDLPEDCQLLVIANPITALDPAELEKIEKYLNLGGRLLVLFSADSLRESTGLEKLLANWGVEVGRNFVFEAAEGQGSGALRVFVTHFGNHPVVNSLGRARLLLIMPRSIGPRVKTGQSADAPKVVELASTGPDGVARQAGGRVERQGASIPLMVAVEKGAIQGITEDRGAARIVVVGDSRFLVNSGIEVEANRDFARNAVQWLLNRDLLVQGISTRTIKEYRITMTPAELSRIRWLFLAGFPGGVLLLGFAVWLRRRV